MERTREAQDRTRMGDAPHRPLPRPRRRSPSRTTSLSSSPTTFGWESLRADRLLSGSGTVAPASRQQYHAVFGVTDPLWKALTPEASLKVRKRNDERLFAAARVKLRVRNQVNVR